jgi:hypothetical protein
MSEYLQRYLVAVKYPDVSGFEHLDMLLVRDKLAQVSSQLTSDQQAKLAAADQRLLSQAAAFHAALSQVTNLANERQQRQPPPEHWWWYLDVLAQPPPRQRISTTTPVAA